MGQLIFSAITSVDGYVADADGNFDWAAPDEQVHTFVNDLQRPVGTYLFGRRMYEVMAVWDSDEMRDSPQPHISDFAHVWTAAEKVVYSRTLRDVSTARTTLEHSFDAAAVADRKRSAERDLAVSGPTLAASAFRAGLVDELQLILTPAIVGGGTPALPRDVRLDLTLLDQRRFDSGVVFLRYRVTNPSRPRQ